MALSYYLANTDSTPQSKEERDDLIVAWYLEQIRLAVHLPKLIRYLELHSKFNVETAPN